MGKDEVTVKKRRKITTTTPAPESVRPVVDVYKAVVDFEENEARKRSADKDAVLFRKICQDIRALFSDISELKSKGTEESKIKINEKRVEASLLLVALKKLNRLEKVRTKTGRDALHKEKQRVDSTHLLLQNLLYEADHLNKEVTKCLQFKSKDQEIDLVPVEDFYKEAPEEVTRPAITKTDEHQLRLSRLEWELRQRRELSGACSELVSSKQLVAAAINAARGRLEALAPQLKTVLTATRPMQESLSLKLDEKRDETRAAGLLPAPLFLLYANAKAYSEAFGEHVLGTCISGDEEEARRIEQNPTFDNNGDVSNDSDSDQDNNEDERDKKKRHHRSAKVTKQERAEEKKKQVLRRHPLTVQLSIKLKDESALNLSFYYVIRLNIITIKSTVNLPKPVTGVSAADVLNGHNILYALYPEDTGSDSPHPATAFIFKSAGISGNFSQFLANLGRPYIWAQRMCGLDFLPINLSSGNESMKSVNIKPSSSLSSASVESVLIALRKRLKARVGLMKELMDLESGKIAPFQDAGLAPIKLSGSLTQWQSVGWPEYTQAASTDMLISSGIVNQNDLLYRAIITRQSAKLVALVAVKSEYPRKGPIFSLTLHWNGTHHAGTDDDIRDIERCINTNWGSEEVPKVISLSGQITKLLLCLDILLEAIGSSEFPPDKVMFMPVRGRNRIKPYKFLKQGTGVFTQY